MMHTVSRDARRVCKNILHVFSGIRTFAYTLHAEHGVELLQEDQPRVETPGQYRLPSAGVLCVSFLSFSSLSVHLLEQMEQKMTASDIFKDKKDNYPQSVPKLFVSTRLSETHLSNHCYTCTSFIFNAERLEQHISSCSDGEDINPKVLQALGNEKMKVG